MHSDFMYEALQQAVLGRGKCAPNPSVGSVLVHQGNVIARAFHQGAGTPHAEYLVLQQIPKNKTDVTLYVTLEPCNHWGKTPPCVDAIIEWGITRVVYAVADANPVVACNNTPQRLRAKGIEVIHWPCLAVSEFYRSYQHWLSTGMPFITAKLAQSLDGGIAKAKGNPVSLSNQACAEFTHHARAASDAILTTARTVRADNPRLTARLSGQEIPKPLAILDRELTLTGDETIFQTAAVCHLFYDAAYSVSTPLARIHYHPIKTQEGALDLHAILRSLGKIGYHDVWVEAGGRLFSALHVARLVQTTYVYITPKLLGETATKGYHNDFLLNAQADVHWKIMEDNAVMRLDWKEDECLQD